MPGGRFLVGEAVSFAKHVERDTSVVALGGGRHEEELEQVGGLAILFKVSNTSLVRAPLRPLVLRLRMQRLAPSPREYPKTPKPHESNKSDGVVKI